LPRSIEIILLGSLVGRVNVGDDIVVIGIFTNVYKKLGNKEFYQMVIIANNVKVINNKQKVNQNEKPIDL